MPKETFFNLPGEKQERIIEAAMDEFAARSYHQARVTAIADNAGIAKGSFYQYFEDKKDLFKHLMDLSVKKKIKYINQDMMANKEKYKFFQLLREIYLSGIRFAKENPRLVAIGNDLVNNKELQQEVWGEFKDRSKDFFQLLLEEGLGRGELDPAIDIVLVSKLLTALNYSLIDLVYKDGKIDLDTFENEMEVIDKMLHFIENGIKNRNK